MSRFRALGVRPGGGSEWVNIDAPSVEDAAANLIARGITPIDIRTGTPSLLERLNQPVAAGRRLTGPDIAFITEQLATLLEAGLPLERCLELLARQADRKASRRFLGTVHEAVRGGTSFSDALSRQDDIPAYYIGVVRASERGGRLRSGLADLALALRQSEIVRQQLISALTYPAIVLATTLLALVIVLTRVVPEFESVFAGEEDRLPVLTQVVVLASRAVTQGWPYLLLALLALSAAGWLAFRNEAIRGRLGAIAGRLPAGDLPGKIAAARFLRVLSAVLANGVPLAEALNLAAASSGRFGHAALARSAATGVREGKSLTATLASDKRFPETAVRLLEVGEESGELAAMALRAANLLEAQNRARTERIVAIANPVAVILLGGLVALLIAGVMLGIFSLNDFVG